MEWTRDQNSYQKWTAPLTAIAAIVALTAVPARAAPGPGPTNVSISSGVTIQKNDDLHFGNIAPGTAVSRIRVNPNSGAANVVAGDAIHLGGAVSTAKFTVSGAPLQRVRLTFGSNVIFLTRVGGTERLRVNRFRRDGPANRFLDAAGKVDYAVGAQVRVRPTDPEGVYVGTFDVTVNYF